IKPGRARRTAGAVRRQPAGTADGGSVVGRHALRHRLRRRPAARARRARARAARRRARRMMALPPLFDDACAALQTAPTGPFRRTIVSEIADSKDFRSALLRMRDGMRSHSWQIGSQHLSLGRAVKSFDQRTREDGFHVLHDWDGKADTVNEDIIPVDVLHYVAGRRGDEPPDSRALAILLDYYFVHLLALLSVRIWDDGDGDANLDRLDRLLREL